MKHASPAALDRLEPLLESLRKLAALKERSRGIFYRRSRAFLHFHEHGAEFFADLRVDEEFERYPATSGRDRKALIDMICRALDE